MKLLLTGIILTCTNILFGFGELPNNKNKIKFIEEFTLISSEIDSLQQVYFQKNGRYFQGIVFPDTVKNINRTDDKKDVFDRTKKPTDEIDDWESFGFSQKEVWGQYEINVYENPLQEWGYNLGVKIKYPDGKLFANISNVGSETHRDSGGWVAIIEEETEE